VLKGNDVIISSKEDVKTFVKNLDFRNQKDFILLEFEISSVDQCKYHIRLGSAKPEFIEGLGKTEL
jgi:hypothetical protein